MESTASDQTLTSFHPDRLFYLALPNNDESGWYFWIRGGVSIGPYKDRVNAEIILEEMIDEFRLCGDNGGRFKQQL